MGKAVGRARVAEGARAQAELVWKLHKGANQVLRGGWPHQLHIKIIFLMKTPKDISERLGEFITYRGKNQSFICYLFNLII